MKLLNVASAVMVLVPVYTAQATPYLHQHMSKPCPSQTSISPEPTTTWPTDPLAGLSKTAKILLSDTRVDAINHVLTDDHRDFVFDFEARKSVHPPGEGGQIVVANRDTFPALTNQGIGMAMGFIGPCGFNTPHIHNRATELLIVTNGEIVSEMVVENGVEDQDGTLRNIRNTIGEYQMTPYFQGYIHSQFNPNCNNATFVAPQSSEDFGVNQVVDSFAALGTDTIRATVGSFVEGKQVDAFRNAISPSVALGVEQCLAKCGIDKDSHN